MGALDEQVNGELRRLVDQCRDRCLWFIRKDFYPQTRSEALRAIDRIQRHGNLEEFKRAGKLNQWLPQTSSGESAGQSSS